jgi:hypothetical protein
MALEVFNRKEIKYRLTADLLEKMQGLLSEYMEQDAYNVDGKLYTITNIYYDTEDDALIRHSLSKPVYKEKLRLRAYGVPENTDKKIYVEIKKKYNGIVGKRRTSMPLSEAYKFTDSGTPPTLQDGMNRQVLKEIEYMLEVYSLMPKVYIAYDRLAYYGKDDGDLRVSFDFNIRTRRSDLFLEFGDDGEVLLPEDVCIMEVKASKKLPKWLTGFFAEHSIFPQSFSKYGTEYKKYLATPKKAMIIELPDLSIATKPIAKCS